MATHLDDDEAQRMRVRVHSRWEAPFGTAMDKFGGPLTMVVLGGILTAFFVGMTRLQAVRRRVA